MDEHQRQLGRHCQVCGSKGATHESLQWPWRAVVRGIWHPHLALTPSAVQWKPWEWNRSVRTPPFIPPDFSCLWLSPCPMSNVLSATTSWTVRYNFHVAKWPVVNALWCRGKAPKRMPMLASFPGCLLLRFLDHIHDLWTARRSGRRPGITSTSSNRKVDSIMTYVDSVLVIMATCPRIK